MGHINLFLAHLGKPAPVPSAALEGYENAIHALCLAIAAYRFVEPPERQNGTRALMKPSSLNLLIVFSAA
jgi:hypothetical protein